MMEKMSLLRSTYERLRHSLLESVGHFRSGRDILGLNAFSGGIDDIEDIVQTCLCLEEFKAIDDLLPCVRALDAAAQNEDITAMTDILEFTLLPLAEKKLEGMDEV